MINKKIPRKSQKKTKKADTSPHVHQNPKISFDLNIRELPWTERQKEIIDAALVKKSRLTMVDGIWGSGKAQPLDSIVMTPFGPKRMGDLQVGDSVCTPDGGFADVLGIFPQGVKKIVSVNFSDGSSVECCEDHLWLTQTMTERNSRSKYKGSKKTFHNPKKGEVRSTKELRGTLNCWRGRGHNHTIPMTQPAFFKERNLPLDPYILGCLIGDGSFRGASVSFTSADSEIPETINRLLPAGTFLKQSSFNYQQYNLNDEKANWRNKNRIVKIIEEMGMMGHYSYEKFIPEDYKLNSVENRIAILRGLMDTGGCTNKDGVFSSFETTSPRLAEDVKFIIESLGGTSKITKSSSSYVKNGERVVCRDSYEVVVKMPATINPFLLKRKAEKWQPPTKYPPRRYISSITDVGRKECQCIYIDSEDHLYLTDNFVVTHNTIVAVYTCLQLLKQKKISNILYIRNIVQSGTGTLGWLGGDLETRLSPYMLPFQQKLDELLPTEQVDKLIREGVVESQPVALLRGTSYNCYGIIIDEAGCMSKEDLLLTLSRVGSFSYVFLVGDSWQVDLANSGFKGLFNLFNDEESKENHVYAFELKEKTDIMRSELLRFIMRKVRPEDN
jgi:hypothetical protein